MKIARIAVLGVALVAGGLAAVLAGGRSGAPPQEAPKAVTIPTSAVLVAAEDLSPGTVLESKHLVWKTWPQDGAAGFITRAEMPNAPQDLANAVVRQPFVAGEPIREQKIIKAGGSGFMSAILTPGMRAIATEITAETGAGGFILPNDRVDVLLTKRDAPAGSATRDDFVTNTILTDVRVLAIDQTVEEKDGQKVVVGRTATLELTPRQTELLALSRQMGTLSLALRPLTDAKLAEPEQPTEDNGRLTVVRYGITTQTTQR